MIDLKRPDIMKAGDIVLEFLAVSNPEESPEIQESLQLHIEKGFTPFGFSRHPHCVQYLLIPTYTLPLREVKRTTINFTLDELGIQGNTYKDFLTASTPSKVLYLTEVLNAVVEEARDGASPEAEIERLLGTWVLTPAEHKVLAEEANRIMEL